MKPKLHPRDRLKQLAQQNKVSLAALSRMIGRPDAYLQRYVRLGKPNDLAAGEVDLLSRFYGVGQDKLSL